MRTLVLDGGGMRGSYAAGVMAQFLESGIDYKYFDNYVGPSASSGTIAYFLADQFKEGIKIWEKYLPKAFARAHFLSFNKSIKYFNKIFCEIVPLNLSKISSRKQKQFVPLTNLKTMKTEYKCLNTSKQQIDVLLASMTWPLFSPPRNINGNLYYDGGLTASVPLEKAKDLGSDEIWLIMTTPPGYRRKKLRYKFGSLIALHKPTLRKMLSNRPNVVNPVLEEIEASHDFVVIRPEKALQLHWRNTNPVVVKATIELGKQAATEFLRKRKL